MLRLRRTVAVVVVVVVVVVAGRSLSPGCWPSSSCCCDPLQSVRGIVRDATQLN